VQFIKHDELEPAGVVYHLSIESVLPCQQKLGHHEVREKDIGRIICNPLTLLLAFLTCVAPHYGFQVFGQA
jgi:hypothetical protein